MGWRCGLSDRALALQAQSPEFKLQICMRERGEREKEGGREGGRERI
jgi:hypothetical protein